MNIEKYHLLFPNRCGILEMSTQAVPRCLKRDRYFWAVYQFPRP